MEPSGKSLGQLGWEGTGRDDHSPELVTVVGTHWIRAESLTTVEAQ
jgi:hypothetical protein